MTDETILVRIKKLLALATSSNPHEAAVAAAKAQALLLQHNVAMADVDALDLRKEGVDRFDWSDIVNESNKSMEWRDKLFHAVAGTMWCKGWSDDQRTELYRDSMRRLRWRIKRRTTIIGRPSDVEVARYLYEFLIKTGERLSRDFIAQLEPSEEVWDPEWEEFVPREPAGEWRRGEKNAERHAFLKGFAAEVARRLKAEWQEQRTLLASQSNELMVVREHELADYMSQHGIVLVSAKTYHRSNGNSQGAGKAAGAALQISRGMGGGSASAKELR